MKIKKCSDFLNEAAGDINQIYLDIKNEYSDVKIKQMPGYLHIVSDSDVDIKNLQKCYGGTVEQINGRYLLKVKGK